MGQLVEGQWSTEWYDTKKTSGRFVRSEAPFRNWITPDGSPGPSGEGGFAAEAGRYHLYISHACPWAHRTVIFRLLKGLNDAISISVVSP
ncbi:MAG TPA: glutathione S-transferase family protein, partial [Devosia sp.]|nr:glutathione S-transferase family protein [Devosia sp.]